MIIKLMEPVGPTAARDDTPQAFSDNDQCSTMLLKLLKRNPSGIGTAKLKIQLHWRSDCQILYLTFLHMLTPPVSFYSVL